MPALDVNGGRDADRGLADMSYNYNAVDEAVGARAAGDVEHAGRGELPGDDTDDVARPTCSSVATHGPHVLINIGTGQRCAGRRHLPHTFPNATSHDCNVRTITPPTLSMHT